VLTYDFGGYSTLTIERRGGALQTLPDPWLGKTVALSIGGVVYFQGNVSDSDPHWTDIGWVTTYQCRDLKARCDRVPLTDSNTLTDTCAYNLPADDPLGIGSRQGRNVGQILTDVLTMTANATALNARGVGGYTSMGPPPVLPSSTVSDLAAMTIIPPNGCYVQGEKLISAIESFARQWAPNHYLWIEPATGAIRFIDQRTVTNHTLTMGTDPIDVTPLRRSVGDNFGRVLVRGMPIAERKVVSTLLGGIAEHFDYGSVTNSAAKAAWTPQEAVISSTAKSEGTCTCTDTLDVVVHSTDATQIWAANFWDQTSTGHLGVIDLYASGGAGLTQWVSRRIASNAALTAGGTANCVMDLALPAINYDHYKIYGVSNGLGWCWKRYHVTDATVAAAMARQLTYPAPWVGANGDTSVMTSYPMGSVCWSASGSPPFEERPAAFTFDPISGNLYFLQATYITNGNRVPSDVRALLAVNVGENQAIYPPDSGGSPVYAGTSYTVEGMTETLTVTCLQWRDPANQSNMNAYAHDLHDSVKDTIVSGTVVYHGQYLTGMQAGQGISIAGNGYTTGYEGLSVPIRSAELHWEIGPGRAVNFTTVMQLSNRRAHYTSDAFLRPDRPIGGQQVNWDALTDVTGSTAGLAPHTPNEQESKLISQGAVAQSLYGPSGAAAIQADLKPEDQEAFGFGADRAGSMGQVGGLGSGVEMAGADPLGQAIGSGSVGMANADIASMLAGQEAGADPSPRVGNMPVSRGGQAAQVAADIAAGGGPG
jgi:hypothetical protein